jgi:arylsulfatase A-like enzyme
MLGVALAGMDRRAFLQTAAGAAAVALPGCGNLATPAGRPNVLFVFADQLRADVCGTYGGRNIATPNIDRLASQGVVFTNAVSSAPLCSPYRGMLQTGRYPTHSGVIMNFLETSHVQNSCCLADVFGGAGYQTGFIGKWHLGAGLRREESVAAPDGAAVAAYQSQHPETEFVAPGAARLGYRHWQAFNFHMDFNNYWYYEDEPKKLYSGRYETDTETAQAIAYMERCRQAKQPFLLMVAPHPPHPWFDPSEVPAGYLEQIPEDIPWPPNVPTESNPRSLLEVRCYLAMAKNVDDNVGRLLDYLDTSGLAASTIVVFSSDHGEMHGSHGRVNKLVPYAESIDIPCLMRWPQRIPAGLCVDALQTPMDHLPTLCRLAGLPAPGEIDGIDLSAVATGRGDDAREDVLLGIYVSECDYCQSGTAWPEWRGVRTKQYTYCRWLTGSEELYDNLADPYQMNNLADGAAPEILIHLRARLYDLLAAAHDDFRPGNRYVHWFDDQRNLVRTGWGPVPI